MTLQNRVNPQGAIKCSSARGAFMGNRGVLHDSKREVTRQFKTKAWITCLLEFKGRKRELMTPGLYTELFFLDEVTAFAAGHRPCAECRRARYNEFRDAWSTGNQRDGDSAVRAHQMDEVLHRERIAEGQKLTWRQPLAELPHGAMFQEGENVFVVHDSDIFKWSFDGYSLAGKEALPETVEVLTPSSVVNVFKSGFRPEFHPSAISLIT